MLDPRVGRWFARDPKENKYPYLSPYSVSNNSPLIFKDPDGKDVIIVIWASQSDDGTGKTRIGHAGMIVENYKKVETKLTKNGKEIIKTEFVPDGTYTYFDLWPGGDGANMTDPTQSVDASYNSRNLVIKRDGVVLKDIKELETFVSNNDVSKGEGYAPDGVVKIKLSPEDTRKVKKAAKIAIKNNRQYNPKDNNCSTFVCESLNAANIVIPKEENYMYFAGKKLNQDPNQEFHTPNNLYRVLEKNNKATIIKDSNGKTDEDYEDAVVDPAIDENKAQEKSKG